MSLNPVVVLDRVLAEYREHLRTEFRAKDPGLRASLEAELDRRLFLAQEPFFQAHRPFRKGKHWSELGLDPRLARAMAERTRNEPSFHHQSLAIEELLSSNPRPVVVTTGTGSGKTEAFLLPVLQNAVDDATQFTNSGLTALLVYPMNALANDQELRIKQLLEASGFGFVKVGKYDRSTPESERETMRSSPPHILLTNYMMLEYLLVRPLDREAIFANHRCRYLVLDEVHTYRGGLGTNIALLVRRLRVHLTRARQDWNTDVAPDLTPRRFPELVSVGTSATIKSLDDTASSRAEALASRDATVRDFFSKLTGEDEENIRVLGEELEQIEVPTHARYPDVPAIPALEDLDDIESVRRGLCTLAGAGPETPLEQVVAQARILWDLNRLLVGAPSSLPEVVDWIGTNVPERRDLDRELLGREVIAALMLGAALPDGVAGGLRLRAHRLFRGGWRFHRCVDPNCGRIYPMGEGRCSCGHVTAPLFLCRNCGADYLRFTGDPDTEPLRPSDDVTAEPEWLLYEPSRFERSVDDGDEEAEGADEEAAVGPNRRARVLPTQIRSRPVRQGSFSPHNLLFSSRSDDYPLPAVLAPARTRCLCCGGTAGSRSVLTPVSLGTSAALKVLTEGMVEALAEANRGRADHDGKERLLIFSDSRQDAAHQARFIRYASRYDRMRRAVTAILDAQGPLGLQELITALGARGVRERDNPHVPQDPEAWLPAPRRQLVQAWEEAPLLDDLAVTAGYRASLLNLGLVGVEYFELMEFVEQRGEALATALGVTRAQLWHLCRCLLDDMRSRSALSRQMLQFHPLHPGCPDYVGAAAWERRIKTPAGYSCDEQGRPVPWIDANEIPPGIQRHNLWRREGRGGASPRVQRVLTNLLHAMGGAVPDHQTMLDVVGFLLAGSFLVPSELAGRRDRRLLLQVNDEAIRLRRISAPERLRCDVCATPRAFAAPGAPCPSCHGRLTMWPDEAVLENRYAARIARRVTIPLFAHEHTAQVPAAVRQQLEEQFKSAASVSPLNVLACSPTLEMGIDVGGLDAVALRNVPPRPDNYAQRGGRSGRRARVGLVIGYARRTPHDQYFYDRPAEMIAGEVPAPSLALGNRDAVLRHLNAIVFGSAEPGLAGRMVEYVTANGQLEEEKITELVSGLQERFDAAIEIATASFVPRILAESELTEAELRQALTELPGRVRDVFERTARQVTELRQALDRYAAQLTGRYQGVHAGDLVARLLGIPSDTRRTGSQADDRSAGYPLRRFAEFGLLPGYEFPSEPAALRLLSDQNEDEPINVGRRFGIGQYQPDATVYARGGRWRVAGLDRASPWNPQPGSVGVAYRVCGCCGLRVRHDQPSCPRCRNADAARTLTAQEFGGFLAIPDERPILEEEDRFATRNLVRSHPQWDGAVTGRWAVGDGWSLRLSAREEVLWMNEGFAPTPTDFQNGVPVLHQEAKGFLLCSHCGRILTPPPPDQAQGRRGRRAPRRQDQDDPFGHARQCPAHGQPPHPVALLTASRAEILRLIVPVPGTATPEDVENWGMSLGSSIRLGIRHLFMLDGSELEFEFEGPWAEQHGDRPLARVALSFIDPNVGGTGYLRRAAQQLDLVAQRAIEHLDHPDCETACYRCLKSYSNQRHHEKLHWPLAMPHLELLAGARPTEQALSAQDIDAPQPWLEAYEAGVGSPLEFRFLRIFEAAGLTVRKQEPVAPEPGQRPISVADFAIPEARVAIYIDGLSIHVGHVLRRDRRIRDRLRSADPPWSVVELTASDLSRPDEVIQHIRDVAAAGP